MDFNEWLVLQESNMQQLYTSTELAFPRTRKRQHAVDEIDILSFSWTPYLGVNTLFLKALAKNETNGREYNPIILFKKVRYHDARDSRNLVEIADKDGRRHLLERLSQRNEVQVRCDCKDFYWRFNYEDKLDRSLWGRVRAKYEALYNPGSSNPLEMPGVCKHIIKLAQVLNKSGIMEG